MRESKFCLYILKVLEIRTSTRLKFKITFDLLILTGVCIEAIGFGIADEGEGSIDSFTAVSVTIDWMFLKAGITSYKQLNEKRDVRKLN